MDLPTPTESNTPVSIIGPQYCASSPLELQIGRNIQSTSDGNFVVTDIKGSVIFKVQEKEHTMHGRCVLVDDAGNPIVTTRKKTFSAHKRWKVFKDESDEESNLIFTVRRPEMLREKTKLHVFLVENKKEDVCDFKVEKGQSENLLVVCRGESSTILAEMQKKKSTRSPSINKDNYAVRIYPNIDYAFIVILIVIYNACNENKGENGGHNNWIHPLPKLCLGFVQDMAISVATEAFVNVLKEEEENGDEDEKEDEDEEDETCNP